MIKGEGAERRGRERENGRERREIETLMDISFALVCWCHWRGFKGSKPCSAAYFSKNFLLFLGSFHTEESVRGVSEVREGGEGDEGEEEGESREAKGRRRVREHTGPQAWFESKLWEKISNR